MLAQRVGTAVLLLFLFLACLFSPWNIFPYFVTIALAIAAWEWASLIPLRAIIKKLVYLALLVALVGLSLYFEKELGAVSAELALAVLVVWLFLLIALFKYPRSESLFKSAPFSICLSVIILVSSTTGLLWIYRQDDGAWLILLLVAIVACADTGAYFAGRFFGRTPLASLISPKKTIEGFLGGLVLNLILAVSLCLYLAVEMGQSLVFIAVVLATSLFSVEGDLLESVVKRSCGAKDSGTILPGHGGVLDRVDGLCAATPCFVFGMSFLGL